MLICIRFIFKDCFGVLKHWYFLKPFKNSPKLPIHSLSFTDAHETCPASLSRGSGFRSPTRNLHHPAPLALLRLPKFPRLFMIVSGREALTRWMMIARTTGSSAHHPPLLVATRNLSRARISASTSCGGGWARDLSGKSCWRNG